MLSNGDIKIFLKRGRVEPGYLQKFTFQPIFHLEIFFYFSKSNHLSLSLSLIKWLRDKSHQRFLLEGALDHLITSHDRPQ